MAIELRGGLVRRVERGAREFELPARLERNGGAALPVVKADQVAGIVDPLPAEPGVHPLEQRANARFAPISDGRQIGPAKQDLLMLGADAKGAGWLASCFEPGGERIARFDDCPFDDVASHEAGAPAAGKPPANGG